MPRYFSGHGPGWRAFVSMFASAVPPIDPHPAIEELLREIVADRLVIAVEVPATMPALIREVIDVVPALLQLRYFFPAVRVNRSHSQDQAARSNLAHL